MISTNPFKPVNLLKQTELIRMGENNLTIQIIKKSSVIKRHSLNFSNSFITSKWTGENSMK